MIAIGLLLPGQKIPPERKLAESLGVNRTTVLIAYQVIRELLELPSGPDHISFAVGKPPSECIPLQEIHSAQTELIDQAGESLFRNRDHGRFRRTARSGSDCPNIHSSRRCCSC